MVVISKCYALGIGLQLIAIVPCVESFRAGKSQVPMTQELVKGRFATGGPHSCLTNQVMVAISPSVQNKVDRVRAGNGTNLAAALKSPYEAIFGHPEVTRTNYMKNETTKGS
ncbi:hypothetical protein B7463_g10509, partial [Scytalidium lignicola]